MIAPARRHVYILGPLAHGFDLANAIRRAEEARADLVLLCIGRVLSRTQTKLIEEAVSQATDGRFNLEAEWIVSEARLGAALAEGDQISILAEGHERKRIDQCVVHSAAHVTDPWTFRRSARPYEGHALMHDPALLGALHRR